MSPCFITPFRVFVFLLILGDLEGCFLYYYLFIFPARDGHIGARLDASLPWLDHGATNILHRGLGDNG